MVIFHSYVSLPEGRYYMIIYGTSLALLLGDLHMLGFLSIYVAFGGGKWANLNQHGKLRDRSK